MPMHATTVRFTEDVWQLLEREAEAQGVSSAQLVRDAAIMRIAFLMAERDDPAAATTLDALVERMAQRRRGRRRLPGAGALEDPARLDALVRTGLLDSGPDEDFDRFTRLVSRVLGVPVALVSLVDRDRQYFKSCLGLPEPWAGRRETPLSHSFCQHPVVARETLVVADAREQPLVRENLAIDDLGVIAYLGVPLITAGGHALGALCAIDHEPREWTPGEVETLEDLAAAVVGQIELRLSAA